MLGNPKVCSIANPADCFAMPAHPQFPKLRSGTQLDAIYERLITRGFGFRKAGNGSGKPLIVVVFDTQCTWSHEFWKTTRILDNDIDFFWFPVCVSADYSTAQAASILAAKEPWEVLREHEESFADPDFCGIHSEDFPSTQLDRDHVWENARIFRKAGGTSVPLAIWRSPEGNFIPFFGDTTPQEIRTVLSQSTN